MTNNVSKDMSFISAESLLRLLRMPVFPSASLPTTNRVVQTNPGDLLTLPAHRSRTRAGPTS